MPYIEVIPYENAEGELKEIYDDLVKKRGKLAEVHKIQSLNPRTIVHHMDLYMSVMFGRSPLKRYQREMMAVVVSSANDCPYCRQHHGEALNHFWKNADRVERLADNYREASLEPLDLTLCEYAYLLTRSPEKVGDHITTALKLMGASDRALLDAALVISYFNFVNRMVLGLGVQLEEDGGSGYEYD
jgi:uncharacterized peroxidase-related enzyme